MIQEGKVDGQNGTTFCRTSEQVGGTLLPDATFQGRIRYEASTKHKVVPLTVSMVRKKDSKGRFKSKSRLYTASSDTANPLGRGVHPRLGSSGVWLRARGQSGQKTLKIENQRGSPKMALSGLAIGKPQDEPPRRSKTT